MRMGLLSRKLRVGMDIGSSAIKVVGFKQSGRRFHLQFSATVDLVQEYELDSVFAFRDEMYVEQMKKLKQQFGLAEAVLAVSLPADTAILKVVNVNSEHISGGLANMVESELQEGSSYRIDDMQIVCLELDGIDEPQKIVPLFACAVPHAIITRYKMLLKQAKLTTTIFDLDALGIYNAFCYAHQQQSQPSVILHVGARYSLCIVTMKGKSPFFKTIALGGNDMSNECMDVLELDFSAADLKKREVFDSNWSLQSYEEPRLGEILGKFVNSLTAEIRRCILHYQAVVGISGFGEILLSGGGGQSGLLADGLQERLGIPTKVWNPMSQFIGSHRGDEANPEPVEGINMTAALGTVLRGDLRP